MTSREVTDRLRRASDLRDLCVALRSAMKALDERSKVDMNEPLPKIQKLDPDTEEAA